MVNYQPREYGKRIRGYTHFSPSIRAVQFLWGNYRQFHDECARWGFDTFPTTCWQMATVFKDERGDSVNLQSGQWLIIYGDMSLDVINDDYFHRIYGD